MPVATSGKNHDISHIYVSPGFFDLALYAAGHLARGQEKLPDPYAVPSYNRFAAFLKWEKGGLQIYVNLTRFTMK